MLVAWVSLREINDVSALASVTGWELNDGAVKMGPGTLYGTLNRLVDDGLIVETTDRVERSESERRRYYELTPNGRAVALAELARVQTLVQRVTGHLAGGAVP